jgi:ubiquinone/menaquinone biosynthesis C-methylase UbiE
MALQSIRFDDGATYEHMMGAWSRLVGQVFLDWLSPATGLRWIDVGCGNGAFTEVLTQRCSPSEIQGVDPSEAQLAFARTRPGTRDAEFLQGNATALPFDADRFDAAVMALVIFFMPEPAKGVAEMTRVVRPGGLVAAYVWDILDGGSPTHPVQAEMRALGFTPLLPPGANVSRMEALRDLWTDAGLDAVETREIAVQRTFADFEDFWRSTTTTGSLKPTLEAMKADAVAQLQERVRARLPADAQGRIAYGARANAVRGRVPRSA